MHKDYRWAWHRRHILRGCHVRILRHGGEAFGRVAKQGTNSYLRADLDLITQITIKFNFLQIFCESSLLFHPHFVMSFVICVRRPPSSHRDHPPVHPEVVV